LAKTFAFISRSCISWCGCFWPPNAAGSTGLSPACSRASFACTHRFVLAVAASPVALDPFCFCRRDP